MKKSRKINIIIALIIILAAIITPFSLKVEVPIKKICFELSCLNVEIADTPQERAQGLMFRAYLPRTEGMLFIFTNED